MSKTIDVEHEKDTGGRCARDTSGRANRFMNQVLKIMAMVNTSDLMGTPQST
ncbi:hypothetical protein GCM10008018_60910 [Paenibacillus marchantiophytorum]|uniref:Uncharacterized protein n=1 Tax=Paenibacillus marchantiophytorum TaxID=1619310 RepID=A0ABQ1FDF8_9BACL|nr:hypothetical protein GCM10008018_60910 [Paenibacillus marchantiophytorum]